MIVSRIFLGICELKSSHTRELILAETKTLFLNYDLTLKDIFCIVTDNASNVIKAFKPIL